MKAGFEEILIAPQPCGLKWAKGSVPTPRGMVQVSWEIVQNKMNIDVKVPEGVKYRIVRPEEW